MHKEQATTAATKNNHNLVCCVGCKSKIELLLARPVGALGRYLCLRCLPPVAPLNLPERVIEPISPAPAVSLDDSVQSESQNGTESDSIPSSDSSTESAESDSSEHEDSDSSKRSPESESATELESDVDVNPSLVVDLTSDDADPAPGPSGLAVHTDGRLNCYCKTNQGQQFIACSKCGEKQHTDCFGLTPKGATRAQPTFMCLLCDPDPDSESDDNLYDVERIEGHWDMIESRRLYQVKWHGYRRRTWEPEANLAMCSLMLKRYQLSQGLLPVEQEEIGGAVGDDITDEFNLDNWVTPDQILSVVNKFKNLDQYRCEIDVAIFRATPDPKIAKIYVLLFNRHYFAILYRPDQIPIVVDGRNEYIDSPKTKALIDGQLGVPGVGRRYLQQSHIDHCGSSAALIALRMRQHLTRDGMIPDTIRISNWLIKEMRGLLHRSSSVRIADLPNIGWTECGCCRKKFKAAKTIEFSNHVRKCSKND